ncbi:MAG: hypothetical protein HYR63_03425 [Proteobacteria bacterium]|nr:hypothetical protein [Pseudomonadota bacterium]
MRRLHQTSLPIPHAGGTYPAKPPINIPGGLLTFDSAWTPALGAALEQALTGGEAGGRLQLGCVAAHGHFRWDAPAGSYEITYGSKPATAFMLNLISMLQLSGTVPMIDVQAYARWLDR